MFVATGIQTCTHIFLIRSKCSTLRQQLQRRSHNYFCKIKFCGCCRIFPSFDLFPQLSKIPHCLFPLTSHLCNHCFSKPFPCCIIPHSSATLRFVQQSQSLSGPCHPFLCAFIFITESYLCLLSSASFLCRFSETRIAGFTTLNSSTRDGIGS